MTNNKFDEQKVIEAIKLLLEGLGEDISRPGLVDTPKRVMKYWRELTEGSLYTNKEIAEMMGISESTVATQLSLAVKFMREQLMKHYDKIVALLFAFFC